MQPTVQSIDAQNTKAEHAERDAWDLAKCGYPLSEEERRIQGTLSGKELRRLKFYSASDSFISHAKHPTNYKGPYSSPKMGE